MPASSSGCRNRRSRGRSPRSKQELGVSLFHRHARGLILTEQGELLHHTAHEVFMKLEAARAKLTDSRERPNGDLRVTTTPGIGVHWLTPRLGEFIDLYPDIHITLMTTDEELDLAMREADVAIRLRQPTQPDLIQRKLFSVHFHAYASPEYVKRFGTPRALEELDSHRIIVLGGTTVPTYLQNRNWLIEVARNGKGPRIAAAPHQQRARRAARLPARRRHRAAARTIWSRRTAAWCSYSARAMRRRSTPISSIPRNSSRSRAFRCSATSWSRRRSAGISRTALGRNEFRLCVPVAELRRTCISRNWVAGFYFYFLSAALHRMAGMPMLALSDSIIRKILRLLLLASGCPSSQIAIVMPAAVPLWKVIVGPRADKLNRTRKGPVFLVR